ncbi:cytoskeleton-associated protein 2-like [Anguilla rostrata]|uniref:cytoskeleton-associated protein 2-like n=1 Tax=Anguilla rostrata TaxID=7938 RepID=UPI0030CB1D47
MNEDDAVRKLSRLEMRKQKLMEYLAAKGKLKPPNSKPYLRDDTIKHKRPEGSCSKTSNAAEGKENQGREPPRLQLAEKPKPQSSAGASRQPLSSSANVLAARAPECPRLPAPAGACAAATARAKPQPPRALPGPAAALRATKACSVAGPIRAGAHTVTSSRNGPKAATTGRTATESRSRPRPVPTAAASGRTVPAASALAKTVPAATAQARTRPSAAATRPGLHSAGPRPSALSKACGNTAVAARTLPSASAPFKTRSRESAPASTGRVTAAPPRTGPAATASSKPGPGKAPPARGPPAVRAPAPKAIPAEVSSKRRSAPGPTGPQTRCGALQQRAAGPAGRGGPVLRSAGSKPTEHAQSLPARAGTSLSKPGAESARASARLAQRPSQLPRPGPKAAAPQRGRAGGRSLATAGRAGDAGEGQRVTALQRAVRQAMTEMRRGQRLAGSGGQGEKKGDSGDVAAPNAAPSTVPPSTVPRSARQSCQPLRPADLKTPPRTGGAGPDIIGTAPPRDRKMTTAQEERMQKLQEWRRSKGISYKRPPMPVRPRARKMAATPQHYWTAMEEEEEAQSLVYNIDRSLTDCVKLLQEGCCSEQVQQVLSRVPMAQKFAKYWICRARLMEREGELEVLPLFEEAVRVVMEPVDELRVVVFEILKKKEEMSAEGVGGSPSASEGEGKKGDEEEEDDEEEEAQQPAAVDPMTPRATSALICGAKGGSSVVKYKITATPGGRRSQSQEPVTLDGQELRFFTPVRRSVRIERSAPRYPAALREHDPCVASFRDLLAEEEEEGRGEEERGSPLYVYRENEALRDQVQIHLQYTSGPGV